MSAAIATMNADFGISAEVAVTGAALGLSAGIWRFKNEATLDVTTAVDPAVHIITPCLSGDVDHELQIDGRLRYRRQMARGAFNLVRAGETPRAIMRKPDYSAMLIFLPDSIVQQSKDDGGGPSIELLPIGCEHDPEIDRFARLLATEMRAPTHGSRLMADGLTLQLAVHMVRHWSNLRGRLSRRASEHAPNDWRIRRSLAQLEERLGDDIGLAELAAEVELSSHHYTTLFRAATGLPPHAWVMKRRIERACELLADRCRAITDIAVDLGFASSQHFATVFRKHMGTTPSEYRRERLS